MPVLNQSQNRERKDYFQELFHPNTLTCIRPRTDSLTIFRPLPEFDANGNLMPMVKVVTAAGPDFSNVAIESAVINTGASVKYSGLCGASDSEVRDDLQMVMSSLYIKLTSKMKKGDIPTHLIDKVRGLLAQKENPGGGDIKHRDLERSQTVGFMQGVALTVNGKQLDKPAVKQVLVMGTNLCRIMSTALGKAYTEQKLDVFHPKTGCVLIIKGLPKNIEEGRMIPIHTVEIGKQTPIAEASAKSLWVPWDTAFKRITVDQQIMQAVRCFGRDVVELLFPDDVARLCPSTSTVAPVRPATQPAAAAAAATAAADVSGELALDLSGATTGSVDEGGAEEETGGEQAATQPPKPASPDKVAADYASVLGKL